MRGSSSLRMPLRGVYIYQVYWLGNSLGRPEILLPRPNWQKTSATALGTRKNLMLEILPNLNPLWPSDAAHPAIINMSHLRTYPGSKPLKRRDLFQIHGLEDSLYNPPYVLIHARLPEIIRRKDPS